MEDRVIELVRFNNPTEAGMLVSLLQSEGIESYVRDELLSQEFDIGGAKVELLEKDAERAKKIMREYGYTVSDELEEPAETDAGDEEDAEGAAAIIAEYEKNKAKLSRRMTILVILMVIFLALILILNKLNT